jgi:hypothetical protein
VCLRVGLEEPDVPFGVPPHERTAG